METTTPIDFDEKYYKPNKQKYVPFTFQAEFYHKIATNDYNLLYSDRVPGFIKSEGSEIF